MPFPSPIATISEALTLALRYQRSGNQDQAEQLYRQILQMDPGQAEAWYRLGLIQQAQGRFGEALDSLQQAVRLRADYAEAHNGLGIVLAMTGQLDQAAARFDEALRLAPHFADAWNNLGNIFAMQKKYSQAIPCFQQGLRLKPDFAETRYNLGLALQHSGNLDEAATHYRHALSVNPSYAEAYSNLGIVLLEQGRVEEAMAHSEHALRLRPSLPEAHNNLGNIFLIRGQIEEAAACYRRAPQLQPDDVVAHSNLLFCLNHDVGISPEKLYMEHCHWGEQHGLIRGIIPPHANDPTPDRRLRIGYVSPDFRVHAVARFFEPILANHDGSQVEVFCYAQVFRPDATTERLRSLAHVWRWICGLSDDQVAQQIRSDRIDILIDLAGHTANHRLGVFAHKPAPVQATYMGYPNTTGLRTIDYRLTDAIMDPPQEPIRATEELVRLPRGVWCFAPPVEALPVAPLPALRTGRITFGSLHRLGKLNARVLDLWCRIVQAVPCSRLLIFRNTLAGATREQLVQQLRHRGLSEDQFALRHETDRRGFLGVFDDIDIGLDPFPFTGGTISCESLWMGVPFVTLRGDRPASRGGATLLSAIGLPQWIVETPEHLLERTVALGHNLEPLAELRAELRQRMQQTLCDGKAYTRDLEAVYRQMWQRWCAGVGWSQ